MPIAFGSAASTSGTFLSSITVNVPAGTVDGELLLLFTINGAFSAFTTPTGWTALNAGTGGTNTEGRSGSGAWWRIASSEPASYSISHPSANYSNAGFMLRYTGVDTTNPIRDTVFIATGAAGTATTVSPTPALLTGVVSTDMTIIVYGATESSKTGAWSIGSDPAGWTNRVTVNSVTSTSFNDNGFNGVEKAAGTDRPTMTANKTANWAVSSVALQAAVSVAMPPRRSLDRVRHLLVR